MRVILVVLDTLRADHLSAYGYVKSTGPNLQRLAAEGALLTDCYASDVPTIPAFTSLVTGKRGITTGVVAHDHAESAVSPGLATLSLLLAKAGVLTGGVSSLFSFKRWFAKGFTHYMQPDLRTCPTHITADRINALALPWLRSYGRRDCFLLLHYWDPHSPYSKVPQSYVRRFYEGSDPHDPANTSLARLRELELMSFYAEDVAAPQLRQGITDLAYLIAQYDAEIAYADEYIGHLTTALEGFGLLEDTLLIITADHGEAFGEHDVYFDHMDVYEQTTRLPLILWAPGRIAPQRIGALVQSIDLAPTILEALGAPVPADLDGRSLWPLLRGETCEHRSAVFSNQGLWSAQRAMRTPTWTLVETLAQGLLHDRPPVELFDREADRAEAHNLADDRPDVVERLQAELAAWLQEHLQGRPDPLREAGERSTAPEMVKARLRERRAAPRPPEKQEDRS